MERFDSSNFLNVKVNLFEVFDASSVMRSPIDPNYLTFVSFVSLFFLQQLACHMPPVTWSSCLNPIGSGVPED